MSHSEKEQPCVNYLLLAGKKKAEQYTEDLERGILDRVRQGSRHTDQNLL